MAGWNLTQHLLDDWDQWRAGGGILGWKQLILFVWSRLGTDEYYPLVGVGVWWELSLNTNIDIIESKPLILVHLV